MWMQTCATVSHNKSNEEENIIGINYVLRCVSDSLISDCWSCIVSVLNKGQVLTDYYRLLNKRGGYVWVQTCATISYSKNSDDENMIGINYVLR